MEGTNPGDGTDLMGDERGSPLKETGRDPSERVPDDPLSYYGVVKDVKGITFINDKTYH